MKRYKQLFYIVLVGALISGCAANKASEQPEARNLEVFYAGVPREQVIGEIGAPAATEINDGLRTDIFTFQQGYSDANKTGRVVGHSLLTVGTLGLWELVGNPIETNANGIRVVAQITYDKNEMVYVSKVYFDGKRVDIRNLLIK